MNKIYLVLSWLLNSGLFYLGWILTLKFVLNGMYWQGPLLNLAIVILHVLRVPNKVFELVLVATIPLMGSLLDTALAFAGILEYVEPYSCCHWIAPLWVTSLWALFATSINHSLEWAGRNLWMAAVLGGIGGTMSYLAAIKIGAARFMVSDGWGIFYLAIGWAIAMPLCYAYNRWLKKRFEI